MPIVASKYAASTLFVLTLFGATGFAQMGGGGDNSPAFSEPKFIDKLYEAGGPRARQAKDGSVILSVKIEGNQSVSENAILTVLQSREDRVFDHDTFNRDIAALYRTNLFKKIDSYFTEAEKGVHIKLVVVERPIVREVYFTGNKRAEDRALIKQAGLTKGDPLDPISINSAKSRLIEFYQDKGMNQVDIQVRSGLKPGERDVDFVISEGPVERLNDVKILGNKVYSSDLLYAKLKNKGSRYGLTKYLFNVVSDNKIEDDRQLLMGYYRQLGYFDARVDFRKDYNEAGDFVDVTFIIFEGERYKVRSVSITGTKRYQASELLPHMKSKEGAYFSLIDKSKDERFIYELYGVQGHYFCDVVGELVYQPGNQVDIIYNVGEGDIYRISDVRVHLEGDYTKERVVLQPLAGLRPGSILNSVKVEEGTRRLKATTLFNVDPSQGILPSLKVEPPEDVDSIDR